jgi:hypothetical protein
VGEIQPRIEQHAEELDRIAARDLILLLLLHQNR